MNNNQVRKLMMNFSIRTLHRELERDSILERQPTKRLNECERTNGRTDDAHNQNAIMWKWLHSKQYYGIHLDIFESPVVKVYVD